MRRRFLGILLLSVLLSGCAPPGTFRKIRNAIRQAVITELGPADRYDVSTSRDGLQRLLDGRMKKVSVRGVNVRPIEGVVLDEVFLDAKDVEFDRGQKKLKKAGETVLSAWVSEQSLASIAESQELLSRPTARILDNNTVELSGYYEPLGLSVPISARGRISVVPPSGIAFVSDEVRALGVPVPKEMRMTIDLADIYEPIIVHTLTTGDKRVTITGTVDWTKVR